jgi:hypothetical protein
LGLLDDRVQQDHLAIVSTEKHPGYSPAAQVTPDFPKALTPFDGSAKGHADGGLLGVLALLSFQVGQLLYEPESKAILVKLYVIH